MPPVFGGAPTCPTCDKKVYAAEQTLGPGGRAFHKLCLKCAACGKLLEPRLLVDHDGLAYCKSCHGKSFGTKGYGVGGALVGEYQPRFSPTRPISSPNSPVPSPTRPAVPSAPAPTSSRPPLPPKPIFGSPSSLNLPAPPPRPQSVSNDPPARENPPPPTIPSRPSFTTSRQPSPPPRPSFETAPTPAPPIPSTASHSTPSFSDDEDDLPSNGRRPLPFASSQFAPKSLSSSGDLCRRCGTQVYFAEQIIAVGSKWHKRCLRCASCSTTLNSHLLEKDREPYCKKCYQQNFGTGSLGITSRPGLY
ncbi:hypothetical protein JCM5353_005457 [Sporobolomyces roseus]